MAVTQDPIKIIEIKDGHALIQVSRLSICYDCHLTDWMAASSMFETWIDNRVGAKPGDYVQIKMKSVSCE